MSQFYEAIVSRTTYYRVVVDLISGGQTAKDVLADMEADSEDVEQYRVKGFIGGSPYGNDVAVIPPMWQSVTLSYPSSFYGVALPTDTNETADIEANVAV